MASLAAVISDLVVRRYIESHDFNGLPLSTLIENLGHEAAIRSSVGRLIKKGDLSCLFFGVELNPHIKRLREPSVEDQLNFLKTIGVSNAICYPTEKLIKRKINLTQYDDRPFTKRLVLGAGQLEFESFEASVLDRYINDPRYHCDLGDYAGRMSIGSPADVDATVPKRDKVFLQTFGLGYTETRRRVIVVYLRYLHTLSPEHQQAWNSYRVVVEEVKMLREYYENTILGEFTKNVSYFTAIKKEINIINKITTGIVGKSLFIRDLIKTGPRNFHSFECRLFKILTILFSPSIMFFQII
jgi:hypothetical protein